MNKSLRDKIGYSKDADSNEEVSQHNFRDSIISSNKKSRATTEYSPPKSPVF